jgi:hypothetical protein
MKVLWCLGYFGGCIALRAVDRRELDEIRGFLLRRRAKEAPVVTVRYDA